MNRRSFFKITLGFLVCAPFIDTLGPKAHAKSLLNTTTVHVTLDGKAITKAALATQGLLKRESVPGTQYSFGHWFIMLPKDLHWNPLREEILVWDRAHGIEPNDTYRIEVNVDRMTATVYQYERNAVGAFYLKEQRGGSYDIAVKPPFTVAVTRLPPGGYTEHHEGQWQPLPQNIIRIQ